MFLHLPGAKGKPFGIPVGSKVFQLIFASSSRLPTILSQSISVNLGAAHRYYPSGAEPAYAGGGGKPEQPVRLVEGDIPSGEAAVRNAGVIEFFRSYRIGKCKDVFTPYFDHVTRFTVVYMIALTIAAHRNQIDMVVIWRLPKKLHVAVLEEEVLRGKQDFIPAAIFRVSQSSSVYGNFLHESSLAEIHLLGQYSLDILGLPSEYKETDVRYRHLIAVEFKIVYPLITGFDPSYS